MRRLGAPNNHSNSVCSAVVPEPLDPIHVHPCPDLARLRHANQHRERLLAGTLRKSRFSVVRAVVDPQPDIGSRPRQAGILDRSSTLNRLIWIKCENTEISYAESSTIGRKNLVKKMSMLGAVLVGAAILCSAPISVQWSQEKGLSVSLDNAYARVGRPLTATSVAGVARRTGRRAVRRCAVGVTCY